MDVLLASGLNLGRLTIFPIPNSFNSKAAVGVSILTGKRICWHDRLGKSSLAHSHQGLAFCSVSLRSSKAQKAFFNRVPWRINSLPGRLEKIAVEAEVLFYVGESSLQNSESGRGKTRQRRREGVSRPRPMHQRLASSEVGLWASQAQELLSIVIQKVRTRHLVVLSAKLRPKEMPVTKR
jgi:hypothetical protein